MPKHPHPLQLGPFTVLPLLLNTPPPSSTSTHHYLYLRPDRSSDEPASRTLFVANLPVDADDDSLRAVFSEVGAIEDVVLGGKTAVSKGLMTAEEEELAGLERADHQATLDDDDDDDGMDLAEDEGALEIPDGRPRPPQLTSTTHPTTSSSNTKAAARKPPPPLVVPPLLADSLAPLLPSGSSTAKITFLSSLSLARSLTLPPRPWRPTPSPPTSTATSPHAGLARLLRKHEALRPPLALVKAHADASIGVFERLQAQRVRATKDQAAMVDEDGFTLVVRGGKYGKDAGGGGVGVASKRWETEWAAAGSSNKKKKSKELKDFYRWQVREQKREDLASMRARFADDQRKVAKLRTGGRFRPY